MMKTRDVLTLTYLPKRKDQSNPRCNRSANLTMELLMKKKKLLLLKKKKLLLLKRKKRIWVHRINLNRNEAGLYNTLIQDLRMDDATDRHQRYLRMSKQTFDHLLSLVAETLTKQDTNMRPAIKPGLKLVVTLHHLADGATQSCIAQHYRLGRSTVSNIIYETCDALYSILQPIYMNPPSGPTDWKHISET